MGLQARMYLLVILLGAILFGIIYGFGQAMGIVNVYFYIIMTLFVLGLQYLISPALVGWTMRIKWVSEKEEPELHRMVAELAQNAGLPKPRVGISQINIPNAFAFGRTRGDGRICVTQGIVKILNNNELRAVLGHEMTHIKHNDMAIITLLSAIPMILYHIAWSLMWSRSGRSKENGNSAALLGFVAFILYFVTNLLVLYGSRIREYYADEGSVRLGNKPHDMATALYRLVHSDARFKDSAELREAESVRAFFVNDPARAWYEVRELSQVDRDMDGTIDFNELNDLRQKQVNLGMADKLMEIFTTHPNMLKRIKHLSTLT